MKEGEKPSASQWNLMIDLLKRRVTGPNMFEDGTGWHFRGVPSPAPEGLAELVKIVERTSARTYTVIKIDPETDATVGDNITGVFINDGGYEYGIPADYIFVMFTNAAGQRFCWPYALYKYEEEEV